MYYLILNRRQLFLTINIVILSYFNFIQITILKLDCTNFITFKNIQNNIKVNYFHILIKNIVQLYFNEMMINILWFDFKLKIIQ